MSVTSVDIDQGILAEAKDAYGVRTNREAIDLALRDAVRRRRQLEAIDVLSHLEVDADPQPIAYGG